MLGEVNLHMCLISLQQTETDLPLPFFRPARSYHTVKKTKDLKYLIRTIWNSRRIALVDEGAHRSALLNSCRIFLSPGTADVGGDFPSHRSQLLSRRRSLYSTFESEHHFPLPAFLLLPSSRRKGAENLRMGAME